MSKSRSKFKKKYICFWPLKYKTTILHEMCVFTDCCLSPLPFPIGNPEDIWYPVSVCRAVHVSVSQSRVKHGRACIRWIITQKRNVILRYYFWLNSQIQDGCQLIYFIGVNHVSTSSKNLSWYSACQPLRVLIVTIFGHTSNFEIKKIYIG